MKKIILTFWQILMIFSCSQVLAQKDINTDVNSLTELNQKQKIELDKILNLERRISKLEEKKKKLEEEITNHLDADYYERTISALEEAKKEEDRFTGSLKKHLDDYAIEYGSLIEIDRELKDAKKSRESQAKDLLEIEKLNKELNDESLNLNNSNLKFENIGREIDKLISELDQKNNFRLWMSVTFSVLVALVIAGFFFIVVKKENISSDIFSGEKGIQFITLFLIIIAVILFGIMGILESRELSALLGALSGYILGRTSPRSESKNTENS